MRFFGGQSTYSRQWGHAACAFTIFHSVLDQSLGARQNSSLFWEFFIGFECFLHFSHFFPLFSRFFHWVSRGFPFFTLEFPSCPGVFSREGLTPTPNTAFPWRRDRDLPGRRSTRPRARPMPTQPTPPAWEPTPGAYYVFVEFPLYLFFYIQKKR